MTAAYAKFISDAAVERALPRVATWRGRVVTGDLTAIPGLPESLGFLPLDETPAPETPAQEGSHYEPRYALNEGETRIAQTWVAVADPPAPPRSLSKRRLYTALNAQGLWPDVKAYMEGAGVWEDFSLATTLDEDDPLIVAAITALKQSLGLTDGQVENLLASAANEDQPL